MLLLLSLPLSLLLLLPLTLFRPHVHQHNSCRLCTIPDRLFIPPTLHRSTLSRPVPACHCLPPTIYLLSVSPRSILDASCAYLPRSSNCCKITVATRVPKTMQPVASPPIRAWPACPILLASRLPAPDPPLAALPAAAVIHCGGKHALSTAMDCSPGMCAPNRDIEARAEQSRAEPSRWAGPGRRS